MPRPGKPRSVSYEPDLARRLRWEREQRGWTKETVARRMAEAGVPIGDSAIGKIESQTNPRRIHVDELMAFASVFEVEDPLELLRPPEALEDEQARRADQELLEATEDLEPVLL